MHFLGNLLPHYKIIDNNYIIIIIIYIYIYIIISKIMKGSIPRPFEAHSILVAMITTCLPTQGSDC